MEKRIKDLDLKSTFDKDWEIEVDKSGEPSSKKQTLEVIVGDRQYTEENYVTSGEDPTASIDALDQAVKSNLTAIQSNDSELEDHDERIEALESAQQQIEEGFLKRTSVDISQVEILSLNTVPKDLMGTIEATKMVVLHSLIGELIYGSSQYNSNRVLIGYKDELPFMELSSSFMEASGQSYYRGVFLTQPVMKPGKVLQAWIEGDDPSGGDSSIKLHLTYEIITVQQIST